jgi:hypothetical protein
MESIFGRNMLYFIWISRNLVSKQTRRAPEQRPLNVNRIERTSCCSSVIFERNFDPNGSKRALDLWPKGIDRVQ